MRRTAVRLPRGNGNKLTGGALRLAVATAPRAQKRSSSSKPRTVVVGSGVMGVSTAYFLAKAGHAVTVIDSLGIAQVASLRNGGLICPSLLTPWSNSSLVEKYAKAVVLRQTSPIKVHPQALVDPLLWKWLPPFLLSCRDEVKSKGAANLFALASYSRKVLDSLTNDVGSELAYERRSTGTLQIASGGDESLKPIVQASKPITDSGAHFEVLRTASAAVEIEPLLGAVSHKLTGGVFSNMDTNGDIHKFCVQLARVCNQRYGVQFVDGQTAASVRAHGGRISKLVTRSGRAFAADNFVFATGASSTQLLQLAGVKHVPVYPIKGYVVEVPYRPGAKRPRVNLVDDANKLYISPLQDSIRISGIAEIAGFDTTVDHSRARLLLDRTVSWLPGVLDADRARFSSCCRPLSPDDVPFVGAVNGYSNLFVNIGHGSKGWTLGFGSSELVSRIVCGERDHSMPIRMDPYSPNRFA